MPDESTPNLPILDDIIKPGDTDKAVQRPLRKVQRAAQAAQVTEPEPTDTPPIETSSLPPGPAGISEPFLEDVLASYRPNIDSLTEEILASIMTELEPLIRKQIKHSLKQHFPDSKESR